jgi:hypothetical protein
MKLIEESATLLGRKRLPPPETDEEKEEPDDDEEGNSGSAKPPRKKAKAKAKPQRASSKAKTVAKKTCKTAVTSKSPGQLSFPGTKKHAPVSYGKSTVYIDSGNSMWRIKAVPGDRVMINRSFKDGDAKVAWTKVVAELKRLNPWGAGLEEQKWAGGSEQEWAGGEMRRRRRPFACH